MEQKLYQKLIKVIYDLIVACIIEKEINIDNDLKEIRIEVENQYIYGNINASQFNHLIHTIRRILEIEKILYPKD